MAVEEQEDFKGRRKREVKNVQEAYDTSTEIWIPPLPPYIDVDELSLYRKKRLDFGYLRDNLKIEEGSFKQIKSEYTRRFKNFYEVLKSSLNGNGAELLDIEGIKKKAQLKLEGTPDYQTEYNESFKKHILQKANIPLDRIMNEIYDNEVSHRLHQLENPSTSVSGSSRRHLHRRPTNLKIQGDYYHLTEHAEKFIEYLLAKRAELCRTPTTLKLGTGEMETKTETTDQFKKYDIMERPSLSKKFTNLHLEGDLNNKTEKQEKFLPFELQSRPPLTKKPTNLHLEGDLSLVPEYRHQYVQYPNPERTALILPSHNLKSARLFEDTTSDVSPFGRRSPLIPFLRESYTHSNFVDEKKTRRSNSSSRYQSNVSLNRTSSHPNLVKLGISDERKVTPRSPQKHAYLNVDRTQNFSSDRKSTRRGSGSSIQGKLFGQPEYTSAFTDFPRERPRTRRPESNFTKEGEVNYLTEKNDKYIEYRPSEKSQPYRTKSGQIFEDPFEKQIQEENQKFEGPFECQPEYRKAYIDYLIKEKPPPGQRRRILEIPDININDKMVTDVDTSSPVENAEKTKPTSKESRPKSSLEKPNSASSNVPSLPKTLPSSGSKKIDDASIRRKSLDKRQRVFQRSLTPSPVPPDKPRTPSPKFGGNWRRHQFKESVALEPNKGHLWNSLEADPPFFVLNDRVQSPRSIRHDLYKEQKWMPSWYNNGQ